MQACLFAVQIRLYLLQYLSTYSALPQYSLQCVMLQHELEPVSQNPFIFLSFFCLNRHTRKPKSELMMTLLVNIVFSVCFIQKHDVSMEFGGDP
jgi:hypothetical protein